MNLLLDTCVISELLKPQPNESVVKWIDEQREEQLFLCTITIGELSNGIYRLEASVRRSRYEQWFFGELIPRFGTRILVPDTDTMITWGKVTAKLQSIGYSLPAMDIIVAAIAIHNEMALVTRNSKDFERTNVSLVNPWIDIA